MIKLTFHDGNVKEFVDNVRGFDVIKTLELKQPASVLAMKINEELYDLSALITTDGTFKLILENEPEGLEILRHSTAHLLAHAVKRLYPDAQPTIGPAIDTGFYYDFYNLAVSVNDFPQIENEMQNIVKEKLKIEKVELADKEKALEIFKNNPFKVEMIKELEGAVTAYQEGDFIDLCRGPHVPNTRYIKAFKLEKTSGAYWRADEKNAQLTRIYGYVFPSKEELAKHVTMLEEAKKRDHREIGKQMNLYSFHDEAPGMVFYHDNGLFIYNRLIDYWRQIHIREHYQEIKTPTILNRALWERSGHWKLYSENMFVTKVDDVDFAIKPMNCPGGILIYKSRKWSYRDLPLRVGELGYVHRREKSGTLSGLFRVQAFTQDDAHIFTEEKDLKSEIANVIHIIQEMFTTFGFKDYVFTLSVRSQKKKDKYLGSDEGWNAAESAILDVLKGMGIQCHIEEGEAKFYGPSLDVQIKDALGRSWQCSTIQLDFNLPVLFNLTFETSDGNQVHPFMLHRVVYGSLERFMGVLVEHFAGKFPLWINPNQVKVVPVDPVHFNYAKKVANHLCENNFRASADVRSESLNKKIRQAQIDQYNYILVVGDKESTTESVTIRLRNNNIIGIKTLTEFTGQIIKESADRLLDTIFAE